MVLCSHESFFENNFLIYVTKSTLLHPFTRNLLYKASQCVGDYPECWSSVWQRDEHQDAKSSEITQQQLTCDSRQSHLSFLYLLLLITGKTSTICIKSKFHSRNIFDLSSTDHIKEYSKHYNWGWQQSDPLQMYSTAFFKPLRLTKLHLGLFGASSVFTLDFPLNPVWLVHICSLLVITGSRTLQDLKIHFKCQTKGEVVSGKQF